MNTKKHAKPLAEATIGDLTDRKCGNCGLSLKFEEANLNDNLAWLSCPKFLASGDTADRHSSYSVPLAETGYRAGDELSAKAMKVAAKTADTTPLNPARLPKTEYKHVSQKK